MSLSATVDARPTSTSKLADGSTRDEYADGSLVVTLPMWVVGVDEKGHPFSWRNTDSKPRCWFAEARAAKPPSEWK